MLCCCAVQGVETSNLSAAASHFLCCLLVPHFSSASNGEESKKRSRRRGRGGGGASDSTAWTSLSGNELWSQICQDAQETYRLKEGLGWAKNFTLSSCLTLSCVVTSWSLILLQVKRGPSGRAVRAPEDVLVERDVLEDWYSGTALNQAMAKFERTTIFLQYVWWLRFVMIA